MGSVLVLVLGFGFGFGFPQAPQIANGNVVTAAGIERAVAAAAAEAGPSWVAWQVPAIDGRGQSCCWYQNTDDRWYGCGLEPREAGEAITRPQPPSGPVPLEAGTSLLVMARVTGGRIERIRAFSDDCPLDAGGRTVRLVEGVTPDDSVRWLAGTIAASLAADPKSRLYTNAISAIGGTAGAAADAALARLAGPSEPAAVRRQAAFWLGQSRGAAGFTTLEALLGRETDAAMRRTFVQAISRSRVPQALPALLSIAKRDADPATRGEAIVLLAQTAGKIAAADISAAVMNDPDTKVQERAVQALSRLPNDDGVPLLITVARTHTNARVRERAMFWLGRSKDPRATTFFEEILISR